MCTRLQLWNKVVQQFLLDLFGYQSTVHYENGRNTVGCSSLRLVPLTFSKIARRTSRRPSDLTSTKHVDSLVSLSEDSRQRRSHKVFRSCSPTLLRATNTFSSSSSSSGAETEETTLYMEDVVSHLEILWSVGLPKILNDIHFVDRLECKLRSPLGFPLWPSASIGPGLDWCLRLRRRNRAMGSESFDERMSEILDSQGYLWLDCLPCRTSRRRA